PFYVSLSVFGYATLPPAVWSSPARTAAPRPVDRAVCQADGRARTLDDPPIPCRQSRHLDRLGRVLSVLCATLTLAWAGRLAGADPCHSLGEHGNADSACVPMVWTTYGRVSSHVSR